MSGILLKNPGDSTSYRVYVDNIGDATISSASFAATGLTFGSATPDNTTTPKSVVVPVSGGTHGQLFQGVGTFSLSSGGPLVRPVTLRIYAS
jgi:hypothetical protein